MTEYDLGKVVGDDGEAGNGIASITKTGTSGLVDTYTITYDDGDTDTFTVTNGSDASVTIQTSWGSTTSDSKVPSEKLTKDSLDNKVSKSSTTGLLKNDGTVMTSGTGSSNYSAGNHTHSGYLSATKVTSWSSTVSDSNVPSEKLVKNSLDDKIGKSSTSGLVKNDGTVMTSGTGSSNWAVGNHTHSAYVNPTKVTSWSGTPSDNNVASEKLIKDSLDDKVSKSNTSGLLKNDGTVDTTSYSTFSGSYTDLTNKPSIPSSSSDLSDGSSLVKTSSTTGLLKNDGSVDTNSYLTTGSASSTYQTKLVSGTSIKTINNESLLGSGNITIQGGSSVDIVTAWESTPSDSKVASEKLTKNSLDGKANSTHEHYGDEVFSSIDLPNLGIFTNNSQDAVNFAINNAIGNKISKSQTVGLVKNDGSIDTNTYLTSSAISGMLTSSDIADNLTTNDSTKVLSAKQGKALNDLIGAAITYINQ